MLASQKATIPEEKLAMIPTPRAQQELPPLPLEVAAKKQAEADARECVFIFHLFLNLFMHFIFHFIARRYTVACMSNDRTPISIVVKQTRALSSTLDLTKYVPPRFRCILAAISRSSIMCTSPAASHLLLTTARCQVRDGRRLVR